MIRRYGWLLLALLLAALVLAPLARRARPRAAAAPTAVPAPTVALTLVARDRIEPADSVVAKNVRVQLAVTNAASRPVRFALAGYEDRVSAAVIEAGATWRVEFLADRPGEGFAWLLDGEPAGTLTVAGSHLEEGHR